MKDAYEAARNPGSTQSHVHASGTAEEVAAMRPPDLQSADTEEGPSPEVIQQMFDSSLFDYVGKTLRVRFLTSEKGKALNEQLCIGISHNGQRVRVIMKKDGQTHLLKMSNILQDTDEYQQVQGGGISDDQIITRLQRVHDHFNVGGPTADANRADQLARRSFLAQHLGKVPPPWGCLESGIPVEEMDSFVKFMADIKPCCCGDGMVDFRRFSSGLLGNNEECSICLEKLNPQDKALAFPCKHLFHTGCAEKWLDTHGTCPTCRCHIPCPSGDYIFQFADYERMVTARLNEWVVSGMCERCQAKHIEADPLIAMTDARGRHVLVYRSQLGTGLI